MKLFGETRSVTDDNDDLLRRSFHSISVIGINLTAFKPRYPGTTPLTLIIGITRHASYI
jgi:hypothetical protein